MGNQENQCPSPKAQQHSLTQFFRRCRSCHWPSGQKSCSLLNQLHCCLLANWAKRISLECVFYASATDRGLALTSKALVLSCDDLLMSFMVRHSGYDSVSQIQIHYKFLNSPKIRFFDKTWPIASAAPLVFFERLRQKESNIGTSWEHERLMAPWRWKKYSISKLRISDPFFSRCFARPCRKKTIQTFPPRHGLRSNSGCAQNSSPELNMESE